MQTFKDDSDRNDAITKSGYSQDRSHRLNYGISGHDMPIDDWIEYRYKLTAINRSDPIAFQAEYLFASNIAPDVTVDLVATSLGIKEAVSPANDRVNVPKWSVWLFMGMSLALILGVTMGVIDLLYKLVTHLKSRDEADGEKVTAVTETASDQWQAAMFASCATRLLWLGDVCERPQHFRIRLAI